MNKMIVNLLITIFKMREVWILLIFLGLFMIIAVLVKNYIDNNSLEISVLSSMIASILILFFYILYVI